MEFNNTHKFNGSEISELLKDYFSSVYSNKTIDLNNFTMYSIANT